VTRAGSGAANNVIRSIRAGDATVRVVGCHEDPLFLKKSIADRNYLIPPLGSPRVVDAYRRVATDEGVGLIVPTTDGDVRELAEHRNELPGCLFLPMRRSIELCQDKFALVTRLRRLGVAAPATREVSDLDDLDDIVRGLCPNPYLWCRIRRGSGSFGALLIRNAAQARAWISYWEEMRGVPASAFIISEYLPGRDFACQTLWKDGIPILIKTTQRMAYVDGPARPSGTSSIGGVHRTVDEPRVAEVSAAAVLAVDLGATGAFSVDIKENAAGVPHVTEINAGRFLTGTTIFDSVGRHNMTATYVKLGLREPVHVDAVYDRVDETYMVRDLDALPDVFSREELLTGFIDLTGPAEEGGCHGVTAAEQRFPVEDDEHRGAAAERHAGRERHLRG
jgi:carbamoyl-phosphate synthase large subunit